MEKKKKTSSPYLLLNKSGLLGFGWAVSRMLKDCIFPSKDDSDDELDALYVKNSCSDSVSLRLQVSRDGGGSGEYPIKMASEDGCNIEGGESESKVSDGKCAKGEGTKLLTDAEVEDWFVSLDALVNKDHSYSFQFCFLDEDKDAD